MNCHFTKKKRTIPYVIVLKKQNISNIQKYFKHIHVLLEYENIYLSKTFTNLVQYFSLRHKLKHYNVFQLFCDIIF